MQNCWLIIINIQENGATIEIQKKVRQKTCWVFHGTPRSINTIPVYSQENPLVHFLQFHESFVVHSDYEACQEQLSSFKKKYSKVKIQLDFAIERVIEVCPTLQGTLNFAEVFCKKDNLVFLISYKTCASNLLHSSQQ